jgi:hypothetical protein
MGKRRRGWNPADFVRTTEGQLVIGFFVILYIVGGAVDLGLLWRRRRHCWLALHHRRAGFLSAAVWAGAPWLAGGPTADRTTKGQGMGHKILVGVAWPYVNGEKHIGQIAGAYRPR